MKSFTNEEYLALCQKLLEEQYDNAVDDYDINKMEWIPSEEIKKPKPNTNGVIDLTDIKASLIKSQLCKCTNFKVGQFKIRLSHWDEQEETKASVEVWEERHKTPNGMPCKVDYPMNFAKDSRFKGRDWLPYFNDMGGAYKLSLDTIVEIVRWMQAIKRMTAFL